MENNNKENENASWSAYFSSAQWVIYTAAIFIGLLMRWVLLDERPLHHDESLHVMYGKYYYDNAGWGHYKYDPMLHGPLMYNILVFVYNSLGVNEWAARFPLALMGSVYMFLPYFFRKYFSSTTTLLLTVFVATSPTLIYWSRFLREDFFVITPILITVYGLFLASQPRKVFWVLLGITLHLCSKENFYVHVALVIGYFIYSIGLQWIFFKKIQSSFINAFSYFKKFPLQCATAVIFSALVFCFLYSGGFHYRKGVTDILTGAPIRYWMHQHGIERIQGPFLFHFYTLSWYESIFVLLTFLQIGLFYRRAKLGIKVSGLVTFVVALLCFFQYRGLPIDVLNQSKFWGLFRVKDGLDVFAVLPILIHPVLVITDHILKKEFSLAAAGYTFFATFFTYNYLGEKVPWLSMYALIAGIIYLGLYFDFYFKKYPLNNWKDYPIANVLCVIGGVTVLLAIIFVVQDKFDNKLDWQPGNFSIMIIGAAIGIIGFLDYFDPKAELCKPFNLLYFIAIAATIFNLRAAYLTNFVFAGEASEYLSQVHTTREFRDLALKVRREIETEEFGYKPNIYVDGDPVWPLTWYFRDMPQYKFQNNSTPDEQNNSQYIFKTWKENETTPPEGFHFRRVNQRGWWVPDFRQMTLKKFLAYALNHKPWSGVGYSYATVFIKDRK